jgi:transposase
MSLSLMNLRRIQVCKTRETAEKADIQPYRNFSKEAQLASGAPATLEGEFQPESFSSLCVSKCFLPSQITCLQTIDQEIFEATVPEDHYLRRVKDVIDFERFRPILAAAYCNDQGRPAIEPLLLLKLEFLQYHYKHSDRQVMMHACTNMAYRHFLDLSLHSSLPHHTLLTYFRQRLGVQRHQQIFDAMVGQARERGLVKDRLRLKDATHVLANIAIPTTIALVAQTRERLLQALEPWAADEVSCQRQRAEQIRQRTEDLSGEERLLERVVHLRELVAWAEVVCSRDEFRAALPLQQPQLQEALEPSRSGCTHCQARPFLCWLPGGYFGGRRQSDHHRHERAASRGQ